MFEDRFDLVSPEHVQWICERLSWHQILVLAAAVSDSAKPKCPSLKSVFQTVLLENTVREINYEKQVTHLFQIFKEASIDFMPFKGPFWSQQLYPEDGWRHIGDIDLLVTKENARKISSMLQEMGYILKTTQDWLYSNILDIVGSSEQDDLAQRGELTLVPNPSSKNSVAVEPHWELMPSPRFLKKNFLRPDDFITNSTTAQFKDISYRIPRLEVQFLYHILHAICQHQFDRFVHIMNMAHFISRFSQLDWNEVYKLGSRREALTPLHYGLKFINFYFPLPKPALTLMNRLTPSLKIRLFASFLPPHTILAASPKHGNFRRNLFRTAMSW